MKSQILDPCIFVKGQRANILQDADFFQYNGNIGNGSRTYWRCTNMQSCSRTAITDGDWIVSRDAHSHPADISSVRAQNFENSLIQQFSRVLPPREVEVLKC